MFACTLAPYIVDIFWSIYFPVHRGTESCDANAKCVGYYGGFNCSCQSGYKGSNYGCININECIESPEVCTMIETCNDIIGSYNCTCGNINTMCHEKAACLNTSVSAAECVCNVGFTGNGTSCVDINECLSRTHNCSQYALCENTEGSYQCECFHGFEGDGFTCQDIDECERDTHDCILPRTCNNTVGGFTCVCGMDGSCDDNAYCAQVENVTSCFCNIGYEGTGMECTDIDECEESPQCDVHATCVNTEGSYRCVCNDHYDGDGFECSSGNVNAISALVIFISAISSVLFQGL